MTNDRPDGTEHIASVRSGTHICRFYNTQEELAAALVPYFTAGLEENELCFWVTSDPMGVEGAKTQLSKAAPDLHSYLDSGQIEIWDHRDWYLRGGRFDADRVLGQWVDKEKRSLDSGYKGLRATGDTAWLEKRDWRDFMVYEAEVHRVLPQHRMTALCTYVLDGCTADGVLEVIRNHQFTLARIAGEWETIESSSFNGAKEDQLRRLWADVLEEQDDERRWIANQLHEVTAQNVSAIALYLGNLQQRKSWPSEIRFLIARCHTLCEQSLEQTLTLSHLLHPPTLDQLGLAAGLRRYIEDFVKRSRIRVEFETGPEIGRLPLQVETHLFRVAQEGLSNVLRHSGTSNAIVRLHRQEDEVILEIEDFGAGMSPSADMAAAGGTGNGGLGILAMQERLRKIGGHLEIRSSNEGTLLIASVRLL